MSRSPLKYLFAAALATLLAGTATAAVTLEGKPKIAFIYFSQKNDGGWSEAHERGRPEVYRLDPAMQVLVIPAVYDADDDDEARLGAELDALRERLERLEEWR